MSFAALIGAIEGAIAGVIPWGLEGALLGGFLGIGIGQASAAWIWNASRRVKNLTIATLVTVTIEACSSLLLSFICLNIDDIQLPLRFVLLIVLLLGLSFAGIILALRFFFALSRFWLILARLSLSCFLRNPFVWREPDAFDRYGAVFSYLLREPVVWRELEAAFKGMVAGAFVGTIAGAIVGIDVTRSGIKAIAFALAGAAALSVLGGVVCSQIAAWLRRRKERRLGATQRQ